MQHTHYQTQRWTAGRKDTYNTHSVIAMHIVYSDFTFLTSPRGNCKHKFYRSQCLCPGWVKHITVSLIVKLPYMCNYNSITQIELLMLSCTVTLVYCTSLYLHFISVRIVPATATTKHRNNSLHQRRAFFACTELNFRN